MAIEKDASRSGIGKEVVKPVGEKLSGLSICFVRTSTLVEKGGKHARGLGAGRVTRHMLRIFFRFKNQLTKMDLCG